jgi:hypothetical protein
MLKQFQELNEAIHFFPHQIQCEEGIERLNHLLQGVKAKDSSPLSLLMHWLFNGQCQLHAPCSVVAYRAVDTILASR